MGRLKDIYYGNHTKAYKIGHIERQGFDEDVDDDIKVKLASYDGQTIC